MNYLRIVTLQDWLYFVRADAIASGFRGGLFAWFLSGAIARFQVLLRCNEYCANRFSGVGGRVLRLPMWLLLNSLRVKLGFTVPLNVFGPGLSIAHYGTIVVNKKCVVGKNCRIHPGVCLGRLGCDCPVIGDNVYLAPGAKIFGRVTVGDGSVIGANAVVNRDVPSGVTVAGVPARIVSMKNSDGLVLRGTEFVGRKNCMLGEQAEVLET